MRRDESGASAVEYGLTVALCAAVLIVVILAFGDLISDVFQASACDPSNGYDCS